MDTSDPTDMVSPGVELARRLQLPIDVESNGTEQSATVHAVERRYGVRVGEYGLLLPAATIAEVIDDVRLCRIPVTPGWFAGVMNQRGDMVPVFALAAMLVGADVDAGDVRVIVVGQGDQAVGLQMQDLPATVMLADEHRLGDVPRVHGLLDEFVTAAYNADNFLWLDWDIQRFFAKAGDLSSHAHVKISEG